MKILSVNAGSSSLKFTLIEMPEKVTIASGLFEKIGIEGSFYTIKYNGEKITKEVPMEDHSIAVQKLMDELIELNIISNSILTYFSSKRYRKINKIWRSFFVVQNRFFRLGRCRSGRWCSWVSSSEQSIR